MGNNISTKTKVRSMVFLIIKIIIYYRFKGNIVELTQIITICNIDPNDNELCFYFRTTLHYESIAVYRQYILIVHVHNIHKKNLTD